MTSGARSRNAGAADIGTVLRYAIVVGMTLFVRSCTPTKTKPPMISINGANLNGACCCRDRPDIQDS